jgi:adenosylhomocysteinase
VFAWKGETLEEYWDCTNKMLTWPNGEGPDLLVDDGGDSTLLIHEGVKAERTFAKTGELPDPSKIDNKEFKIVITLIKSTI